MGAGWQGLRRRAHGRIESTQVASGDGRRLSVVDLTFAIWLVAISLALGRQLLNGDGDPARHLVIGRYILAHGPRFLDPFSFTRAGEPYLAYEWLSQVYYALLERIGGLPAVVAGAGALIAASLALVVAYVRRRGGDPWLAFFTGAFAAVLSSVHWVARPHLFTFLGLALLLHVITTDGLRRLALLAVLFAVWSNLHPGFLYGLVILSVWNAGRSLEELRRGASLRHTAGNALLLLLVPLGATLANPFVWGLHLHALHWLGSDTLRVTNEFMPLAVTRPYGMLVFLTSGLVVAGFAASRTWPGWDALLVFWLALFATLTSARNGPLLAFFALPFVAKALTPVVHALPESVFGRMRAEFARSDGSSRWLSIGAVIVVVLSTAGSRPGFPAIIPRAFSPAVFPAEAIARARAADLTGRLFSEYTWGGFVLREWPGQRLYMDSMADFFGDELATEYFNLYDAGPGWQHVFDQRGFALALLRPDTPLAVALRETAGWRVWYEDQVAVLFVHDTGPPPADGPAGLSRQ